MTVVVLGGSGLVGSRLCALWPEVIAPAHAELDVLDAEQIRRYLELRRPHTLINLAAWADVDGAEAQRGDESGMAYRLNAQLPQTLGEECAKRDIHLVQISTDYVFDGSREERPYQEADTTNPLCWYAQTKLLGEVLLHEANARACIARIEMPYTAQPHPKGDLARLCLRQLRAGEQLRAVADQRITPVFLDDAVAALRQLVEMQASGIFHVAAASWTTPFEFARGIARRCGLDEMLIVPTRFEDFAARRLARRPRHSWLDTTKVQRALVEPTLKSVDDQLDQWAKQLFVVPGHL